MSDGTRFAGIVIPLITPFDDDQELKPEAADPLIEFQIAAGVHGFYVGGSSGECFLQTMEERRRFLRHAASVVAGRVKLIAHVGALSTRDAVGLARDAADLGYDAVAATPPFYFNFTRAEIEQHYRAIAAATALPVFLYNIPSTTGVRFTIDELAALMAIENVVGMKHTDSDLVPVERLKAAVPGVTIFNGPDNLLIAGLAMGADGGIGSTYNVMPARYVSLYEHMRRGEIEAARAEQQVANAVIQEILTVSPGVMPGVKAVLKMIGFDCGPARAPFQPLSSDAMRRLEVCVATHLR
jgi:N-acetylneuraminate lyase